MTQSQRPEGSATGAVFPARGGHGRRLEPEEVESLVERAIHGDQSAWAAIVDEYLDLLWAVALNHRLGRDDAADVVQTTWLRLLEHIHRLNQPSRVGAWLATTARRESLRISAQSRRTITLPDDAEVDPRLVEQLDLGYALDREELAIAVNHATSRLSSRCQELLRLLCLDPAPSYAEIAAAMNMPIGSIGPTRGRCLAALRAQIQGDGIRDGSPRLDLG